MLDALNRMHLPLRPAGTAFVKAATVTTITRRSSKEYPVSVLDKKRTLPAVAVGYEADAYGWAQEQAALLRAGAFDRLDIENIAEELLDVARREYDKLESALTILLLHMLKWDFQVAKRSRSWEYSILEHRRRIMRQLEDNPGLKSVIAKANLRAYESARSRAGFETKLDLAVFPLESPYGWAEITGREFAMPGRA